MTVPKKPASAYDPNDPNPPDPNEYRASSGIGPILAKSVQFMPAADWEWARENGILRENDVPFHEMNRMGHRKFTDEVQRNYLSLLEIIGNKTLVCRMIGVHPTTVLRAAKDDPDFDAAQREAVGMFKALAQATIVGQAIAGHKEIRKDKEGNITYERRVYETRLREMVLKWANPEFVETQKSEVAVTGGAVIVPAPVESVDSWEATVAKYTGKTIDTEGAAPGLPEPKE